MPPLRNTAFTPTQRRHMARVVTALGLAVAAGLTTVLTACADGPTTPASRPAYASGTSPLTTTAAGTVTSVTTLLWASPVTQASASKVIGAAGGTLTLPGGATLTVPKGAVSRDLTFSITRVAGRIVAYDFGPHGTTFATPVTVTQPAAGTNLGLLPLGALLQGAYYASDSDLYQVEGYAKVSEFAPSTVLAANRSAVSFTVKHFSGYLMSTGRQ